MNPKPETRNPSPQTSREAPNLAAKRPGLAPSGAQPRCEAASPDGNPTAESIVRRLPDKPVVNAREISDALFQTTSRSVVAAVEEGKLHAVRIGGQYRISREEAARWIRSLGA